MQRLASARSTTSTLANSLPVEWDSVSLGSSDFVLLVMWPGSKGKGKESDLPLALILDPLDQPAANGLDEKRNEAIASATMHCDCHFQAKTLSFGVICRFNLAPQRMDVHAVRGGLDHNFEIGASDIPFNLKLRHPMPS